MASCVIALAGLLSMAAGAAERPSAEYAQAMRTLAVVAEGLPTSLAAEDVAGLDKLVIKARPALGVLEKYWADRQIEDALQIAQVASKAIAEISVAVHLMTSGPNPMATEGAQESISHFTATCESCHRAHRDTFPDGAYGIK